MFNQNGRIDSRRFDWTGWFVQWKSVNKTYNLIKGEGNKVLISPSLGIALTVYMETISRN